VLALTFLTGTIQGRNSLDKNKWVWAIRDVKVLLWTYEVAGAAQQIWSITKAATQTVSQALQK
jgi:hypothetical protein